MQIVTSPPKKILYKFLFFTFLSAWQQLSFGQHSGGVSVSRIGLRSARKLNKVNFFKAYCIFFITLFTSASYSSRKKDLMKKCAHFLLYLFFSKDSKQQFFCLPNNSLCLTKKKLKTLLHKFDLSNFPKINQNKYSEIVVQFQFQCACIFEVAQV